MHRRSFLRNSAMALGALTFDHQHFFTLLAQDPWKITMLTDSIGIFTEKGGTIAFHFSKEGTTVIDAQFPEYRCPLN